jgi:hypothetical protein
LKEITERKLLFDTGQKIGLKFGKKPTLPQKVFLTLF